MVSVRATQRGYYAGLLREPGDVFEMTDVAHWVEPYDRPQGDGDGLTASEELSQGPQVAQLKAGLVAAEDAFKALDTYLREVYPDLPEHYGMPVDGVRLTIEHLQSEKVAHGASDTKVDIPADWESLHHRSIIAIAQKILPGEQKDMTKEDAITVIKAEIEKRAAQKE